MKGSCLKGDSKTRLDDRVNTIEETSKEEKLILVQWSVKVIKFKIVLLIN